MNIKIHDDKKCKYESFTASVDLNLPNFFGSEVEGYGADEQEAVNNLMSNIDAIVKDINEKYELLAKPKDPVIMADSLIIEDPKTGQLYKAASAIKGLVPICAKCGKEFAAYERDDRELLGDTSGTCRSCKLPNAKNDHNHLIA